MKCYIRQHHKHIPASRRVTLLAHVVLLACACVSVLPVRAQRTAARVNLAYGATLTPNLGVERRIDSLWSWGAHAGFQHWDMDLRGDHNKKLRHVLGGLSLRRYHHVKRDTLCIYEPDDQGRSALNRDSVVDRRMQYFEANVLYSHYNASGVTFPFGLYPSLSERRFQGDLFALGGKYGYGWMFSRHWRLELDAGVAVGYAWFREYDCPHCGRYYGRGDRIFLLPQLGVNVVYIIN